MTLVFWACLAVGSYYLWRVVEASPEKEVVLQTLGITCTTASVLACSLICMIGCCFGGRSRSRLHIASRPRSQEEYSAVGLGPTKDQSPEELVRPRPCHVWVWVWVLVTVSVVVRRSGMYTHLANECLLRALALALGLRMLCV